MRDELSWMIVTTAILACTCGIATVAGAKPPTAVPTAFPVLGKTLTLGSTAAQVEASVGHFGTDTSACEAAGKGGVVKATVIAEGDQDVVCFRFVQDKLARIVWAPYNYTESGPTKRQAEVETWARKQFGKGKSAKKGAETRWQASDATITLACWLDADSGDGNCTLSAARK